MEKKNVGGFAAGGTVVGILAVILYLIFGHRPLPVPLPGGPDIKTLIVISGTVKEYLPATSTTQNLAEATISVFDASSSSTSAIAVPRNSGITGIYPNIQTNSTELHPAVIVVAKKATYNSDAILYFDNTYSLLPQPMTTENFTLTLTPAPVPTVHTLKVTLVGILGTNYKIHVGDDKFPANSPPDQDGIAYNGAGTFNILSDHTHTSFTIRVTKSTDDSFEKSFVFYTKNIPTPATIGTTLNIPF